MKSIFSVFLTASYQYFVQALLFNRISLKSSSKFVKQSSTLSLASLKSRFARTMFPTRPRLGTLMLASSAFFPRLTRSFSTAVPPVCSETNYSCKVNITAPAFPGNMDVVEKSPNDSRSYQSFTLSNGLRVLLISDPNRTQCAAALDVHVGSFSDPDAMPGMAHFCEHMSFLGTEKYPNEDDFSQYLSSNGGSSNAFTSTEDTVYYFDVNANQFEDALDRFSHFFISPLFSEDAVAREVNAVDSEHMKNKQSDAHRIYQLEKQLLSHPHHPYRKFSTGNKDTLELIPRQRGLDTREELKKFHDKYYSGNLMTLAIYGKQSISELQAWVQKYFTPIPNNDTPLPSASYWGKFNPILPQASPKLIEIIPVKNERRLQMMWPIWVKSELQRELLQMTNPDTLLGHLLGHEGSGSLCSVLTRAGWINGLHAGLGHDIADLQMFELNLDLTESGLSHRNDIVSLIFAQLHLLQSNIPDYLLEEMQALTNIRFKFAEKGDAADYVSLLAGEMHRFKDPSLYIIGNRLYGHNSKIARAIEIINQEQMNNSSIDAMNEPNMNMSKNLWLTICKNAVQDYLRNFHVNSAVIKVISKELNLSNAVETSKQEQSEPQPIPEYYDTIYRVSNVDANTVAPWLSFANGLSTVPVVGDDSQVIKHLANGLHFPPRNDLIPQDFTLVGDEIENPARSLSFSDQALAEQEKLRLLFSPPTLICDNPKAEIWYKLDRSFRQPKAHIILSYALPKTMHSAEFAMNSKLFFNCFLDKEKEYLYEARLAGLQFKADNTPRGLQIVFTGYVDKMDLFVQTIVSKLQSFHPVASTYERFREKLIRQLDSFSSSQPYAQARYFASLATQSMNLPIGDMLRAANASNFDSLNHFISESLAKSSCTGLIIGSIKEDSGLKIVSDVERVFSYTWLPENERLRQELVMIPSIADLLSASMGNKIDKSVHNATTEPSCYQPQFNCQEIDASSYGSIIIQQHPNKEEQNSAVLFTFQSSQTTPSAHMCMELLAEIIEQPFYNSLRTQQQLGYIVSAGLGVNDDIYSLMFTVQSYVVSGEEICSRIEGFVAFTMRNRLDELTQEEFDSFRFGLITKKSEPDHRLTEQASRFWSEIILNPGDSVHHPQFDRDQRDVALLTNITLDEVRQYARQLVDKDSQERRLLITRVDRGSNMVSSEPQPIAVEPLSTSSGNIHHALDTCIVADGSSPAASASVTMETETESNIASLTQEDIINEDEHHSELPLISTQPLSDVGVPKMILKYKPIEDAMTFKQSRPVY